MKRLNQKMGLAHLKYLLSTPGVLDTYQAAWEEVAIHYGWDGGFDAIKAKELHIPTFWLGSNGGALVTQPGDVCYCHVTNKNDHFRLKLIHFLMKKLESLNIPVEYTKNDLLINNHKFLGDMSITLADGRTFVGGHISIDIDLDLITTLCTKPMEKIPTGLGIYNISTEDVMDWLDEFFLYFK